MHPALLGTTAGPRTSITPLSGGAQVPWIFVKSQALVKSALQHLRGVDAAATGILVPATGPPRAVLPQLQPGDQNASESSPAGALCAASGDAGAATATKGQVRPAARS